MDTTSNDLHTSILPDFGTSILPGFRFHPTEEELVGYYLKNRVEERDFPVQIIRVLELYRHDPWELPYLALRPIAEKEWFFFVPRDKKYPNAMRPNRVTVSGYWKATGVDKQIKQGNRLIGLKKTLVFYCGRAPSGEKTDWIMNEYRMPDGTSQKDAQIMSLCKIYNKKHSKGLYSKHYVKKEKSEPQDEIVQQYIRSVLQTQPSLSSSCCTSSPGSPAVSDQEVHCCIINESDFNYGPKEEEGRTRSYYRQHLCLDTAAAAASSAVWCEEDDLNYASLFMTPHCDGIIF